MRYFAFKEFEKIHVHLQWLKICPNYFTASAVSRVFMYAFIASAKVAEIADQSHKFLIVCGLLPPNFILFFGDTYLHVVKYIYYQEILNTEGGVFYTRLALLRVRVSIRSKPLHKLACYSFRV